MISFTIYCIRLAANRKINLSQRSGQRQGVYEKKYFIHTQRNNVIILVVDDLQYKYDDI
jgi:hypothetical protein